MSSALTQFGMVPENPFSRRSSATKEVQLGKDEGSLPERLLPPSFSQDKLGSCEHSEIEMTPERWLYDKSRNQSFFKPIHCSKSSPDNLLQEISRVLKFRISLMEGGMLPVRKLSERYKIFQLRHLLANVPWN